MKNFIEDRLAICRLCPIMRMTEFGMKCDERKYISPDGTQGSFFKKDGGRKGCGCMIDFKSKNLNNHCPANKG